MSTKDLIPFDKLSPEEAREIRRKGQKAAAEKRKQNRTLAEAVRRVLDEPMVKGGDMSMRDALCAKVIKNLFDNPNTKGLKQLAEILGEMKVTAELGSNISISVNSEGIKKEDLDKLL